MKNLSLPMPDLQRGFSKFGLLMMLVLLVSGLTFGLKILPVYLDHNFVKGVAKDLIADGRAAALTQGEIREEIANGLRINNVRDFNLNSVTLERENAEPVLVIEYERRVPLVANIDVIISFDDRIEYMMAPLRHLEKGVAYQFKDAALAEQALTHRSANRLNNERLEFLGDSVLGFLIAEELSLRFPLAPEGELSRMRAGLVNQQSLADIATRLGIGELLILGPGELKSGGRQRASILADALEAVLGAIYSDGGLDACRACVLRLFDGQFLKHISSELHKDAKTQLQETLQARALPVPRYEVVTVEGTDHEQIFVVSCHVTLLPDATTGKGRNRRLAEQDAAGQALRAIES